MSDVNASAAATAPAARGIGTHDEAAITTTTSGQPEEGPGKPRSLGKDAWLDLRTNPIFLISAGLIVILLTMAVFPGLFTSGSPETTDLTKSRQNPSLKDGWFGYDLQGGDVYTLTIYGARASIMVGVLATTFTLLVGTVAGIVAGYSGGWIDSVVSRLTDVFFAIPLLLGAILIVFAFPTPPGTPSIAIILRVVAALAILGWTSVARVMRSSVIQVKQADYVQAARARAGPLRIVLRHVLPNAVAPVIVVSTIALGGYIAVEATLSFLGLGLTPPVVSWGVAISEASTFVRVSPHMLLFPSLFLSVTVLAFIMLGDAVRDALDPKLR